MQFLSRAGIGVALIALNWPALAQTPTHRAPQPSAQHETPYTLTLGGESFDPLIHVPPPPEKLARVRGDGPDLHLVQLHGPTSANVLDRLRAAGCHVLQYIHPYTYVVWADTAQLQSARRGAQTRWTGAFLPAYRLLPKYRTADRAVKRARATIVRAANPARVIRQIEACGADIIERRPLDERFETVSFSLPGAQLSTIATVPGVYTVHTVPTDGGLRGEMSAQVCAGNLGADGLPLPGYYDWLGTLGLSGAGVIIANVDSGIQEDHPSLAANMLPCAGVTCGGAAQGGHGTHTAGIMAADGSGSAIDEYGFLRGLGVAPGAALVEQVYSPWYEYAGGMLTLMQESHANGALVSGNSWGPAGSPRGYDDDTMQVDIGVRDADPDTPGNQSLTYVLSIMNGYGGTSSQGTPDEAKNIITVGSTRMQHYDGAPLEALNDLSSNSAHGPALDGRTIPHLVAPGCYVDSTILSGGHGLMCGTSMASPHVSGAVALFVEHYRQRFGPDADPSPALIKAALLGCAHDLAGQLDANGNVLGHPFDSKQGWGRLNVAGLVNPTRAVQYFDAPMLFNASGDTWIQALRPDDPDQPMRLMLVWTDAPGHGLGGNTPAWNNDLDLVVEQDGTTFSGNNFGSDGYSIPGRAPDSMNNTEGVFIDQPAGNYTVRVVATNINSDGVPGVGDDTDQDFALVCYNCALTPGFELSINPDKRNLCLPGSADYTVHVGQIAGFADPVTLSISDLPPGMTAAFAINPVIPPATSPLTIDVTDAAAGRYEFVISGAGGELVRHRPVTLRVYDGPPGEVVLDAPGNGATGIDLSPTFVWAADPNADTYDFELATDDRFTNIVYAAADLDQPALALPVVLSDSTMYYWRIQAGNLCGAGPFSVVNHFTTRARPTVLLVDDDDNSPDVRTQYANALETLGVEYDVWDTFDANYEPGPDDLNLYAVVIWFTGDAFGRSAGPTGAGADALAAFLDSGRHFVLISQDYYYDHGLTTLLTDYLGVSSIMGDVNHPTLTGAGSLFDGWGPYTLQYPFTDFSDDISPSDPNNVAFTSILGNAAVTYHNDVFRTAFFALPLVAVPSNEDRAAIIGQVLDWFPPFIDCNNNNVADHVDILNGTSTDLDGNGVPDECTTTPCLGDGNCDGRVDWRDIDHFVAAMTGGREGWTRLFDPDGPTCSYANNDVNTDGVTDWRDIDPFVARQNATCP